ncbi:uncharacterized protein PV09_09471 [Verruconis gallopava]|uniref:Uncharacterized protein n=1 Tax=Verruconis gallopava TaxID=253628 RepID=A0A0D1ZXH3_9PEZI|nr:uncharacterized protein PV09_09471 [Verruconis gallopava]KIV98774.1 hypothetical protein PV09_09471 [Verruconis gallopava]
MDAGPPDTLNCGQLPRAAAFVLSQAVVISERQAPRHGTVLATLLLTLHSIRAVTLAGLTVRSSFLVFERQCASGSDTEREPLRDGSNHVPGSEDEDPGKHDLDKDVKMKQQ